MSASLKEPFQLTSVCKLLPQTPTLHRLSSGFHSDTSPRVFESSFILQDVTDLSLKKAVFSPSWIWCLYLLLNRSFQEENVPRKNLSLFSKFHIPPHLPYSSSSQHIPLFFSGDLVNPEIRTWCKASFVSLSNPWRRLSIKKNISLISNF